MRIHRALPAAAAAVGTDIDDDAAATAVVVVNGAAPGTLDTLTMAEGPA